MTPIVPDTATLARLRDLTKSVEIADESGNVIGSFVPNEAHDRIMSYFLRPATQEEKDAARAELLATGTLKDAVSTADILAAIDRAKRRRDGSE